MVINIQDDILRLNTMGLLTRLLQDKATKGNILWATNAYSKLGEGYEPGNEIRPERITGENSDLIKTRARRAMEQRTERTRQHAEVFTPRWVVSKMNDFCDQQWFDREDGIHKTDEQGRIQFNAKPTWKQYVDARRMEITAGEAPFLCSRYDVETGEHIPVEERIGLLDRKLRVVSEQAQDMDEWQLWALRAVQSVYGYELQGDNLLIARVNILCTVEEHLFARWRQKPEKGWLEKLCNVIAWNLWQMDGLSGCVPVSPLSTEEQLSLFPTLQEERNLFGETEQERIPCRLFDWRGAKSISYKTLREKGTKAMKFDFIIGNPPYQDETLGDNKGFAPPIYDKFMDASYQIANRVELIHPARFLFNAGSTPKAWNKKMLEDEHFTIVHYAADARLLFPNTEIKGGVAVSYRDATRQYGAIRVFTPYIEMKGILQKTHSNETISDIGVSGYAYHFTEAMHNEHPSVRKLLSKGHDYDLKSNVMDKLTEVFLDGHPDDGEEYIQIMGRMNNERVIRYIKRSYINTVSNLDAFKLFLPKASGIGAFGEPLATVEIAGPGVGATETFFSLGSFRVLDEANNLHKYLKSKFARALLSVSKKTHMITPGTFGYVPLQDFTPASDIDWSKSIPEIDRQLYAKYGLDESEIAFIESHVKEMS